MALVKCSECGHTVSTRALNCPECGVSFQPPPLFADQVFQEFLQKPKKKGSFWKLTMLSIVAFLVLLAYLGKQDRSNTPRSAVTNHREGTDGDRLGIRINGNNDEARDFAYSLTEIIKATWPKAKAVWSLELTPQKQDEEIVKYRASVSYAKAIISIDSHEWFALSETQQREFIKGQMNVLHKPPLLITSNVIDYYSNSSGEVSIVVSGKVVAMGKYTPTKNAITVQPKS